MNNKPKEILQECIGLQEQKGGDYQSENSTVRQADYYPRGIDTINDIIWAKVLRLRSVTDKARAGGKINCESIEDTLKDLINYSSFGVSWLRGGIDGMDKTRDVFNNKKHE